MPLVTRLNTNGLRLDSLPGLSSLLLPERYIREHTMGFRSRESSFGEWNACRCQTFLRQPYPIVVTIMEFVSVTGRSRSIPMFTCHGSPWLRNNRSTTLFPLAHTSTASVCRHLGRSIEVQLKCLHLSLSAARSSLRPHFILILMSQLWSLHRSVRGLGTGFGICRHA